MQPPGRLINGAQNFWLNVNKLMQILGQRLSGPMKAVGQPGRNPFSQHESLVLIDGVLHCIFHYADSSVKYYQLVPTAVLKADFLELAHADAADHLKFSKVLTT